MKKIMVIISLCVLTINAAAQTAKKNSGQIAQEQKKGGLIIATGDTHHPTINIDAAGKVMSQQVRSQDQMATQVPPETPVIETPAVKRQNNTKEPVKK